VRCLAIFVRETLRVHSLFLVDDVDKFKLCLLAFQLAIIFLQLHLLLVKLLSVQFIIAYSLRPHIRLEHFRLKFA